jgi:uncharacterized protein (TIGR02246 family)
MIPKPEDVAPALVEAWNRHDMDAFGALMAEDVEFINVLGMWWRGRKATVDAHKQVHASIFKDSLLGGRTASVKYLRPDVALVHISWDMTGHLELDRSGNPGKLREGVLTAVLTREGAGWLIRAVHNTDTVPI